MNRRKFLASSVLASLSLPFVSLASNNINNKPVSIHPILDCAYELLDLPTLRKHKIRCAVYCASVVDNEGRFYSDEGFNMDRSEPFIVGGFHIKCLPKVYSSDKKVLLKFISNNVDGMSRDIIQEVKENMEYVCFVGYALTENEYKEKFFIPMMRGLTKKRYYQYIEGMKV